MVYVYWIAIARLGLFITGIVIAMQEIYCKLFLFGSISLWALLKLPANTWIKMGFQNIYNSICHCSEPCLALHRLEEDAVLVLVKSLCLTHSTHTLFIQHFDFYYSSFVVLRVHLHYTLDVNRILIRKFSKIILSFRWWKNKAGRQMPSPRFYTIIKFGINYAPIVTLK